MLFLKFIFTNYKENIAMDHFTTSIFREVDYPEPIRFVWNYTWRVTPDTTQFAFVSPLGQGKLVSIFKIFILQAAK